MLLEKSIEKFRKRQKFRPRVAGILLISCHEASGSYLYEPASGRSGCKYIHTWIGARSPILTNMSYVSKCEAIQLKERNVAALGKYSRSWRQVIFCEVFIIVPVAFSHTILPFYRCPSWRSCTHHLNKAFHVVFGDTINVDVIPVSAQDKHNILCVAFRASASGIYQIIRQGAWGVGRGAWEYEQIIRTSSTPLV